MTGSDAPPIDLWLAELGIEVVGSTGGPGAPAYSRDVVIDGTRRYDLRVTIAWVDGMGCSLWAYYGQEAMELPKRSLHRMLRANFDHPFVKFGLTDDDRPMLVTELPASAVDRGELARALVRLAIVSDRLLEETAAAIADRGVLPDWTGRSPRNPALLAAHAGEIEAELGPWSPPEPRRRRRGLVARLLGLGR